MYLKNNIKIPTKVLHIKCKCNVNIITFNEIDEI